MPCDFTNCNLANQLHLMENSLYGEFGTNLQGGLGGDIDPTFHNLVLLILQIIIKKKSEI